MDSIGAFRRAAPAVFETDADPVIVSAADISELVAAAREAPAGRSRLILHSGSEDSLHEMVIALPAESCDHPHINYKSGKSFLALSGQFAVVSCSDDGSRCSASVLSAQPDRWSGARLARLRAAVWHTIIPLAGDTVFLETITGPFTGNYFAEWFPAIGTREREEWAGKLRTIAREAAGP